MKESIKHSTLILKDNLTTRKAVNLFLETHLSTLESWEGSAQSDWGKPVNDKNALA